MWCIQSDTHWTIIVFDWKKKFHFIFIFIFGWSSYIKTVLDEIIDRSKLKNSFGNFVSIAIGFKCSVFMQLAQNIKYSTPNTHLMNESESLWSLLLNLLFFYENLVSKNDLYSITIYIENVLQFNSFSNHHHNHHHDHCKQN